MQDEDEISEATIVHVLDGRQARLSAELRAVYGPVVDEPVPKRLVDLAAALDRALDAEAGAAPAHRRGDTDDRGPQEQAGTKGA